MKYIKKYEDYNIGGISNWWSGIDTREDDDYYYIDLSSTYLTNKIIQLQNGLRDKKVSFYCKNHMKYEEKKVKNVEYSDNDLIFKTQSDTEMFAKPNDVHIIDINKPIKISKLAVNIEKYNL